MIEKNYKAIVEALLFAAGDEVEFREIVKVLDSTPQKTREILDEMMEEYLENDRGIMLRRLDDSYQLATKPEYYKDLQTYFEPRTKSYLTNAAMEALAIIAYNQPVTRATVEKIRGVNSDGVINRLLEKGLICEVGKSDLPGRATLYGTTSNFLRSLGFESLDELPKLVDDLKEDVNVDLNEELKEELKEDLKDDPSENS